MPIDFKVKDVIHKLVVKLVLTSLSEGKAYQIMILTQSSVKHSGTMLKKMREMRSDFTLTVQA